MTLISWGWLILGLLVLFAALSAATESALSRVRRHDLRELGEAGSPKALIGYHLAEDSSRRLAVFALSSFITTSLIAGLISFLAVIPVSEVLYQQLGIGMEWCQVISFALIMFISGLLLFILTSSLPSVMVWRAPEEAVMRLLWVARINMFLFSPLSSLVLSLRRRLIDPLADLGESAMVTEEEIKTLVDAGEEEGSIEEEEKEMIYSIFQLDETLVREIMVPRIDVVSAEISSSLDDALNIIIEAGHSRLPVYEGSLDQIIGLLYAKDLLELLKTDKRDVGLSDILRPAFFVPETKRALDLLSELQSRKVHLAIVVDEYGGTAGIVTIEDIVEEIVGEIFDEYDEAEEALYSQQGPGDYTFAARIDLDDFNRIMDCELSDEMGDTLGGYIYGKMGRIPAEGDTIVADNLVFKVLVVNNRRIKTVRVFRDHQDENQKSEKTG